MALTRCKFFMSNPYWCRTYVRQTVTYCCTFSRVSSQQDSVVNSSWNPISTSLPIPDTPSYARTRVQAVRLHRAASAGGVYFCAYWSVGHVVEVTAWSNRLTTTLTDWLAGRMERRRRKTNPEWDFVFPRSSVLYTALDIFRRLRATWYNPQTTEGGGWLPPPRVF